MVVPANRVRCQLPQEYFFMPPPVCNSPLLRPVPSYKGAVLWPPAISPASSHLSTLTQSPNTAPIKPHAGATSIATLTHGPSYGCGQLAGRTQDWGDVQIDKLLLFCFIPGWVAAKFWENLLGLWGWFGGYWWVLWRSGPRSLHLSCQHTVEVSDSLRHHFAKPKQCFFSPLLHLPPLIWKEPFGICLFPGCS